MGPSSRSLRIASNSKKRIEKGVKPPLKESTLRQRREGKTSFSGHSVKPTPGETRPLLYSQRLFNSLNQGILIPHFLN